MIDLTGKVVLVTGGSRGIGAGIVEVLTGAGADVILHYNSGKKEAEAVARKCGTAKIHLVQADLADPHAPEHLWEKSVVWKGRIDVLVNNAAVRLSAAIDGPFRELDDAWTKSMRVNAIAPAHLIRLAMPHFRKIGGGIIISMSSRPAFRGDRPDFFHDGGSKAALTALARGVARFFSHEEILSYVVLPGMIVSEQIEDFERHYGLEEALREIPLGELGKPRDVANVVAFLASGLARYAVGGTIDVAGASCLR